MKQINHSKLFLSAFRTALIFISGFLIYEILIGLEKVWNISYPQYKLYNFYKRKTIKFILILFIDLLILYMLFFFTGEHF